MLVLVGMARAPLEAWGRRVAAEIGSIAGADEPLVVLAGSRYLAFAAFVRNPVEDPMHGLGIGRRLQWLSREAVPALVGR